MRYPLKSILSLSLIFIMLACNQSSVKTPKEQPLENRQLMLDQVASKVILPTLEALHLHTQSLAAKATSYCQNPTPLAFEALGQAWFKATESWSKVDMFAFGPLMEERLDGYLGYWPVRADRVEAYLAKGDFSKETLRTQGVLVRGLYVAEYLIFAGDTLQTATDERDHRCQLLESVTLVAAEDASRALTLWKDSYYLNLVQAGQANSTFRRQHEALSLMLNELFHSLLNLESKRIAMPMGKRHEGTPQPESQESPFAEQSLPLMLASLQATRELLFAGPTQQTYSLASELESLDQGLYQDVLNQLNHTEELLKKIPSPYTNALLQKAPEVEEAFLAIKELHRLLIVDVANRFNVTPTFSDNDGD